VHGGYLRLTSFLMLQAQREPIRTVGVVSPHDGMAKSVVARNLAICAARASGMRSRVLLVDGDPRFRNLSRLVQDDDDDGDPETASAEETAAPPVLAVTSFPGVDLLTAVRGSSGHLVRPESWMQTLGALATRYGMVFVDCPSVLDSPEGMVLPSCVDRHVLVVHAGQTRREAVTDTLALLGRELLGAILYGGRGA
jgi:Mrp family chromosome partitioning ATPase